MQYRTGCAKEAIFDDSKGFDRSSDPFRFLRLHKCARLRSNYNCRSDMHNILLVERSIKRKQVRAEIREYTR